MRLTGQINKRTRLDTENRVWANVPGFPDLQASTDGFVRNGNTGGMYGNRTSISKSKIDAGDCKFQGEKYMRVDPKYTKDDGTFYQPCVKTHRAVALAFIPNPNNYPQVDHIDGDMYNNNVENLRWCTAQQNNKWARDRRNSLKQV